MFEFSSGQYRLLTTYCLDSAKSSFAAGAVAAYFEPLLNPLQKLCYTVFGCLLSLFFLAVAMYYQKLEE